MIEIDLRATVKSNLPVIDEILGEGFSAGLHLISGESATAKSAFLLQVAQKSEVPAIFLNTEMNNRDLTKRLVTVTTEVELNKIASLPSDERSRLSQETVNQNTHLTIEDGNSGFISINLLKTRISDIVEASNPDTVLLVIDSFNEWVNTAKEHFELPEKDIRAKLKTELIDLSKEYNVTVLLSAQKKASERETIEELEFASNSHLVFSWERGGRPDSDGNKHLNIFIKKNRGGESNKNKIVKFRGELQRFSQ